MQLLCSSGAGHTRAQTPSTASAAFSSLQEHLGCTGQAGGKLQLSGALGWICSPTSLEAARSWSHLSLSAAVPRIINKIINKTPSTLLNTFLYF